MFIDAYAHIAGQLLEHDNVKIAEEYSRKGLDIAQSIIPDDFSGRITWAHLENRPFLRLYHNYTLCQMKLGKFKKAVHLMEQHLAWNPNDNIGVRFIIGDACLMANMPRKAKEYLLEVQNDHPPHCIQWH